MYDQVASNQRRSGALIFAFVALVMLVGWAFDVLVGAGGIALVAAFLFAVATSFASYFWSDKVALAMSRARLVSPDEEPRLHNLVEGLCIAAGLPKPRVYVVDDAAPNAFATGRNPAHAAIAVTTGLLEKMDRIELEGVIAHELSHVKNYDILVSTIAVVLVGMVAILGDMGVRVMWLGGGRRRGRDGGGGGGPAAILAVVALVLLVLAPLAARLMHLAVSRRRESLADLTGVTLTRYPPGLASALRKLSADSAVVGTASRGTAHLWIESPIEQTQGRGAWLNRLFNTHPPIEERIRVLEAL